MKDKTSKGPRQSREKATVKDLNPRKNPKAGAAKNEVAIETIEIAHEGLSVRRK